MGILGTFVLIFLIGLILSSTRQHLLQAGPSLSDCEIPVFVPEMSRSNPPSCGVIQP